MDRFTVRFFNSHGKQVWKTQIDDATFADAYNMALERMFVQLVQETISSIVKITVELEY